MLRSPPTPPNEALRLVSRAISSARAIEALHCSHRGACSKLARRAVWRFVIGLAILRAIRCFASAWQSSFRRSGDYPMLRLIENRWSYRFRGVASGAVISLLMIVLGAWIGDSIDARGQLKPSIRYTIIARQYVAPIVVPLSSALGFAVAEYLWRRRQLTDRGG
jgi:hypothetical protein